jgi:hypothetical protein
MASSNLRRRIRVASRPGEAEITSVIRSVAACSGRRRTRFRISCAIADTTVCGDRAGSGAGPTQAPPRRSALIDLRLGDFDDMQVLAELRRRWPLTSAIVLRRTRRSTPRWSAAGPPDPVQALPVTRRERAGCATRGSAGAAGPVAQLARRRAFDWRRPRRRRRRQKRRACHKPG